MLPEMPWMTSCPWTVHKLGAHRASGRDPRFTCYHCLLLRSLPCHRPSHYAENLCLESPVMPRAPQTHTQPLPSRTCVHTRRAGPALGKAQGCVEPQGGARWASESSHGSCWAWCVGQPRKQWAVPSKLVRSQESPRVLVRVQIAVGPVSADHRPEARRPRGPGEFGNYDVTLGPMTSG